ncbi:hypothetical protein EDM53_00865 [Rickettsiales endosymbiont of Peranema trichophorum]|uniref:hypothetical protein n=1 Tax=Rickettsiales endosymbiont of Peranema trichophorum TaxID=2486577 RepID=UPI0010236012|nr:hypothetical protein [Rickettsiales endosymbiont of Peranema trichophorum]RZI47636.1 hypothetical protein EDM53_00865 [Rickettsiales endosymbiont of Peranema trichophorum]
MLNLMGILRCIQRLAALTNPATSRYASDGTVEPSAEVVLCLKDLRASISAENTALLDPESFLSVLDMIAYSYSHNEVLQYWISLALERVYSFSPEHLIDILHCHSAAHQMYSDWTLSPLVVPWTQAVLETGALDIMLPQHLFDVAAFLDGQLDTIPSLFIEEWTYLLDMWLDQLHQVMPGGLEQLLVFVRASGNAPYIPEYFSHHVQVMAGAFESHSVEPSEEHQASINAVPQEYLEQQVEDLATDAESFALQLPHLPMHGCDPGHL